MAEEIRLLSEQTSQATTNISGLISNVRGRISQTVSSIGDSTRVIASNTENSHMVLSVFDQMKECLEKIGVINRTLSSSMTVFIHSKEGIDDSFGRIDANVHTCLASTANAKTQSQEQTDCVGSLEAQSNTLQELARQLRDSTKSFRV